MKLANPRGGHMIDDYSARLDNYMDGLLKQQLQLNGKEDVNAISKAVC
jgi:hypothetical protein